MCEDDIGDGVYGDAFWDTAAPTTVTETTLMAIAVGQNLYTALYTCSLSPNGRCS